MGCKHNRRHTCKACRIFRAERDCAREAAVQQALKGEKVTLDPKFQRPTQGRFWNAWSQRTAREKAAQRQADLVLSRSKRRDADGKQPWPGFRLIDEVPLGLSKMLRCMRTKKYKVYGVYEMLKDVGKHAHGEMLWHGTSILSMADIAKQSFRPSPMGMLGPGIYVTPSPAKAWMYSGTGLAKGIILARLVSPGTVLDVKSFSDKERMVKRAKSIPGHVTIKAGYNRTRWAWGGRHKPEYCVRYPEQLALVCAVILVKAL